MSRLLSKNTLRASLIFITLAMPFAVSDSDSDSDSGDPVSASISSSKWSPITAVRCFFSVRSNRSIDYYSCYQLSFQLAVTHFLRGFAVPHCKAGAMYSVCVYVYLQGGDAAVFLKPPVHCCSLF